MLLSEHSTGACIEVATALRERSSGGAVGCSSNRQAAKIHGGNRKAGLSLLDEPAPKGHAQWNGTLLAAALKDVSADHVWRILRKHGIELQRRRSWCITTDPEFGPKAADVVGLYLNPPEKAIVLCVDEKPHIQALQRAQGYLRLPDGKAVNGLATVISDMAPPRCSRRWM